MKRPDMVVLFGPVASTPEALARHWLSFLLDGLGSTLSRYFARLEVDPTTGNHDFVDEVLDLPGREALLERVAAQRGGMWTCRVPLGFANADAYSSVFSDPGRPAEVTLQLQIDPSITRFVEEQPETRTPFIAFVVRAAHVLQVPWFMAGLHLPMRPLHREGFLQGGPSGSVPYVAGWHSPTVDASELLTRWQVPHEAVQHSVFSYSVVSRFEGRRKDRP